MSGQTVKYNLKKRLGRGFTFEELKVCHRAAFCTVYFLADSLMPQEQSICAVRSVGCCVVSLNGEALMLRNWPL